MNSSAPTSRIVPSSTSAPRAQSSHAVSSFGEWLTPPTLGTKIMPIGPSVGGVSHSPKELTAWQDCANGADVLLRAVLEMDRVD